MPIDLEAITEQDHTEEMVLGRGSLAQNWSPEKLYGVICGVTSRLLSYYSYISII